MKIKHSKFRNTGILFELLVRQIASDTLANNDSKAIRLVKKYFTGSELAKEHKLYHTIISAPKLTEVKANDLVTTVLDQSKKLNQEQLNKDKYNLIREIKKHYDLESFFKAKINNYKILAATYTLFETTASTKFIDPQLIVANKIAILEHIVKKPIITSKVEDNIENALMKEDKNIRILTYKMIIEKFNSKYSNLSDKQKNVLKEYINNINDTAKLKTFVNANLEVIKEELVKAKPSISDKTVQIKLNEIINIIKPVSPKTSVKDDHLVSLLQYFELIKEIKKVK